MIFQESSDEHRELRSGALGLIDRTMPLARVRELAEDRGRIDVEQRRDAAQLGWFSLLGGAASSFDDALHAAATVAEARGAHLQPGTFIAANLLALSCTDRPAAVRPSCDVELDAIATAVSNGDAAITWVCTDALGHWGTDIIATVADDRHVLSGTSGLVQDAHQVEWLLVRADTSDTTGSAARAIGTFIVAADAPGVTVTRLDGLDLTRTWGRVHFDGVQVESWARVACDGVGSIDDAHLQIAATLAMCETVGAVDRLFTSTVQYAKDRVAFGRPIGSFQAMKHLLADASVALETSKAMAEASVMAVATAQSDAAQIVAMAKSFIGDASLDVVNACWQTHGGIAYTWQHDFHLYLRRVTADTGLYGDPAWHREQLCRANGL